MIIPAKADGKDRLGRFREIVSDPLNLLIRRHPLAGTVEDNLVMLHNGNRVPLTGPQAYYKDFSEILVINRGVHEPLEEYVFQQVLRNVPDCPVMLELGSYWAHYAMWLKLVRPNAATCLVDIDADNLACGRANFQRHGFTGAFTHSSGVNGYPVDDFVRKLGGPLAILHIDVQGDECAVLAGCRQALHDRRITFVFVSTHSQVLHRQVLATLAAADYRIEVAADFDTGTTAHDGFVFASIAEQPVFNNFRPLTRTQILTTSPADVCRALAGCFASTPE